MEDMTVDFSYDVTDNFSYYEFRPKDTPKTWRPEFELQNIMIIELAENLQVLRNEFGMPMTINSGVRVIDDYNRLLRAGYNPSSTSDHYCANIVPIKPTNKKYTLFGSLYSYSVGAGDVKINGDYTGLFNLALLLNMEGKTHFGQIILESTSSGAKWIHFGNNPSKFFSEAICNLINRTPYLATTNGGKSYTKISDEYIQGLA